MGTMVFGTRYLSCVSELNNDLSISWDSLYDKRYSLFPLAMLDKCPSRTSLMKHSTSQKGLTSRYRRPPIVLGMFLAIPTYLVLMLLQRF
jgi:hypothetical protein